MKEYMDSVLELLKDFVNMDSGSNDTADVNRFVDRVEYEFKRTGMAVSRIKQAETGDFIECTAGNGSRKILLLGHMDTVFPSGTAKPRPFSRKEDLLYGPGVLDMKGGLVVLLYAVKNVIDKLPCDTELTVFLNTDEEIGSRYSKDRIVCLAKAAAACLSFEPAKPGTLTTERKGILAFKMDLWGLPSHSGVNYDRGRSAIEELGHKICRLYELKDKAKGISVNVGRIIGGDKINIVAGHAEAEVEIRYFNREDREKLDKEIADIGNTHSVKDIRADIHILSERPPLIADCGSRKLFQMAESEAHKLGRSIQERKTGGGGDASFAGSVGIPVLDGLGPEGEDSHTDREFAMIESFPFKIELASRIIRNLAKGCDI